jgi:hypothetical protein
MYYWLFDIIEDSAICNDDIFRDLTQNGDAKHEIFISLSFGLRSFWVIHNRIRAIKKLNSSNKSRNVTHCQCYIQVLVISILGDIKHLIATQWSQIERVYKVKTIEPRTEPCGKPGNIQLRFWVVFISYFRL